MTYRFGVFEFDSETGALSRGGHAVALERQPALALARLLAAGGGTVTREELRLAIWGPETHVDFDRGLAYCVSQIRGALGDKGGNPRFVQTLPGKGYRVIAPVLVVGAVAPVRDLPKWWLGVVGAIVVVVGIASGWSAYVSVASRTVIAVSIFDNESGLPEYDRLVAGLTDSVVVRLSEMAPGKIVVIGNSAVLRQPRNIRNLQAIRSGVKADYVVLGQLQKAEHGLRFVTHLIRLDDNTHLRANRIVLPDGNVSGLEAAVTAEFEQAVRVQVLGGGS